MGLWPRRLLWAPPEPALLAARARSLRRQLLPGLLSWMLLQ